MYNIFYNFYPLAILIYSFDVFSNNRNEKLKEDNLRLSTALNSLQEICQGDSAQESQLKVRKNSSPKAHLTANANEQAKLEQLQKDRHDLELKLTEAESEKEKKAEQIQKTEEMRKSREEE